MTDRLLIHGRPDFGNPDFGKTRLKRFPPYVYSRLGGMLVHKVLHVEARWYRAVSIRSCGDGLERLPYPQLTFVTACGQMFYAGMGRDDRSQSCVIPKADAVLCGRCCGTGPVFPGRHERDIKRSEARARIGCMAEVP